MHVDRDSRNPTSSNPDSTLYFICRSSWKGLGVEEFKRGNMLLPLFQSMMSANSGTECEFTGLKETIGLEGSN